MPTRLDEFHRFLALSPHLDDAVLSVGGLIDQAVKRGADVVIGTIFTADSPEPVLTSPIIEFLNEAWSLGPSPMRSRREEDVAAVNALGARFIHGNLLDAIYRTDRGNCLYSTREAVFSGPSLRDDAHGAMSKLFVEWIDEIQPDVILCPLAVGRHVDHVITSESFRNIALGRRLKVFLYEDMPYSTGRFPPGFPDSVEAALGRTKWTIAHPEAISIEISRKIDAILKYESQLKELFPDAQEIEVALKQCCTFDEQRGEFVERIWPAST